MTGRVAEIEESAARLERSISALVADRERAWAEVARLKKALDERELEFLQMDEEYQRAVKKFDEERAAMDAEKADVERRLDEVASKVKALLPLLPDISSVSTANAPTSASAAASNDSAAPSQHDSAPTSPTIVSMMPTGDI